MTLSTHNSTRCSTDVFDVHLPAEQSTYWNSQPTVYSCSYSDRTRLRKLLRPASAPALSIGQLMRLAMGLQMEKHKRS